VIAAGGGDENRQRAPRPSRHAGLPQRAPRRQRAGRVVFGGASARERTRVLDRLTVRRLP